MIYLLLLYFLIVTLHPQMRYNVTIQETLAKTLQVEANSKLDAELAVTRLYRNCNLTLSSDDYIDTKISIDQPQLYYKSPNKDFPRSHSW